MIIFDTETTGLITNEGLPLSQQPEIIELAAVRVDYAASCSAGKPVVVDEFQTLVRPKQLPLPAVITKITGIRDEDLAEAPAFVEVYGALARFFRADDHMVAHNARFDQMMLVFELMRIGKQFQFPYCLHVTDSRTIWSGKLQDWGRKVKGENFTQTHRAMGDVLLLGECYFSSVEEA